MRRVFAFLNRIDRRVIFTLVFVLVSMPFFVPTPLRVVPASATLSLYEVVEKLARENAGPEKDRMALVQCDWDSAVQAECWPQTQAMIEHLMQRGIKFAILGFDPVGPTIAERIAREVAKKHGKEYGKDWCNWGYKDYNASVFRALLKDLYSVVERDVHNTPIREIPMMREIAGMQDVGLVFEVTGSTFINPWIQYALAELDLALGAGCTAIIGPDMYPYVRSGQLVGVMEGLGGAAQYETLVGAPARGMRGMGSQNYAHLLIIALILLGNIGGYGVRRGRRHV
jgi:hypothetical protein